MGPRQRILAAALAACAFTGAFALPARTLASSTQQSILMDDDELIYSSPEHVVNRLRQIAGLGVDRIKVSIVWSLIAPNAESAQRPSFDAADPNAYPAGAWDRYDLIAREAHALGMGVYFQLDPPVPLWALPAGQPAQGPQLGRAPVAAEYRKFVQAVGRRYNGTYTISTQRTDPPPSLLGVPLGQARTTTLTSDAIPRVDYWGIWNEPNERSWLNPWRRSLGHGLVEYRQPAIYRSLIDAAWSGLQASGHGGDTILIGETANRGIIEPVPFARELYCVGGSLRPLSGNAAAEFGCPVSGDRDAFARAHPGLFAITGYAHHPYLFDLPPNRGSRDRNVITLASLRSFERTMNGIFATYGHARSGGIPLYMTEWGYKTNPPNPFVHTTLDQQAAWLNQGEYLSFNDPYVRALTQFELVDTGPKAGEPAGSQLYWSTFQTGLMFRNGAAKPAMAAYRIPIWVPRARHGSSVTVWGQLRPANHATLQNGVIEFQPRGGGDWTTIRVIQTDSPEGFIVAHVPIAGPGLLRLAWVQPGTGYEFISRAARIS